MPLCPFDKKECNPECAMYAKVAKQCGFTYQGLLVEEIHDMLVEARQLLVHPPGGPENK